MRAVTSILDLIGNTPLLRLGELEDPGSGEVWAKLESLNPGFSVKDRVGLALIRHAADDGRLEPGGTVVEIQREVPISVNGLPQAFEIVSVDPETALVTLTGRRRDLSIVL